MFSKSVNGEAGMNYCGIAAKLKLETKIPPPVVTLLLMAAMWGPARALPLMEMEPKMLFIITMVFLGSGIAFLASGFLAFRRAKTTIDPVHPDAASALVVFGIFNYTRNPMYVGFTCMLISWAMFLNSAWALLGAAVFVIYTTRFQIIPEERALRVKFGQSYDEYKKRVRRWI